MYEFNDGTIEHIIRIHSGLESLEHKLNYRKRDLTPDELYAVGALHCNGITFSDYGGNENFITDAIVKIYEWIKQTIERIIDGITTLFGGSVNGGKGAPAKGNALPSKPVRTNLPVIRKEQAEQIFAKKDEFFTPEDADLFGEKNAKDLSAAMLLAWEDNNPKKEAIKKKIFDLEKVVEKTIKDTEELGIKYKDNKEIKGLCDDNKDLFKDLPPLFTQFKSSNSYFDVHQILVVSILSIGRIRLQCNLFRAGSAMFAHITNTEPSEEEKKIIKTVESSLKIFTQIIPIVTDLKQTIGKIYIEHMKKLLGKEDKK